MGSRRRRPAAAARLHSAALPWPSGAAFGALRPPSAGAPLPPAAGEQQHGEDEYEEGYYDEEGQYYEGQYYAEQGEEGVGGRRAGRLDARLRLRWPGLAAQRRAPGS